MTGDTSTLTVKAHQGSGGATVVVVVGDIDLASAEHLRTELMPVVERGMTVLDLAGVGFCDSSGLRVLVEADRRVRAQGAALRLAAPTEVVERLLGLTKADEVLELFPDVDSALKR